MGKAAGTETEANHLGSKPQEDPGGAGSRAGEGQARDLKKPDQAGTVTNASRLPGLSCVDAVGAANMAD
jgi:hypothetical protein